MGLRLQCETALIQHFSKLYLDLFDKNKKDIQLKEKRKRKTYNLFAYLIISLPSLTHRVSQLDSTDHYYWLWNWLLNPMPQQKQGIFNSFSVRSPACGGNLHLHQLLLCFCLHSICLKLKPVQLCGRCSWRLCLLSVSHRDERSKLHNPTSTMVIRHQRKNGKLHNSTSHSGYCYVN